MNQYPQSSAVNERSKGVRQGQRFCAESILSVILAAGFYWWLMGMPDHQPLFLLAPITAFVSAFFSLRFTLEPGVGFLGMTRLGMGFVIDKSCSGAVFWCICFCLLCLTQTPRFKGRRRRFASFCASLVLSYFIAMTASILRIIPSILMFDYASSLDPNLVHKIIGILTFLTVICASFLLVERSVTLLLRKLDDTHE